MPNLKTGVEIKIQMALKEKLLELRTRNSSYSLRAFAAKLGMSSGALSDLMNGKRVLSRKTLLRLLDRLLVDPEKRTELLNEFDQEKHRRELGGETSPPPEYLRLSADQFESISDWRHYAILSLLHTKDFRSDPAWIAERLGLSKSAVATCLERLLRLGILKFDEETARYSRSAPRYQTSEDVMSLSIRRAHSENLKIAEKSLENDPVEDRDFSIFTLAVNKDQLPQAKQMIRRFQDELSTTFSEGPMTEVYRFSTQLFPLTLRKDRK